MLFFKNRLAGNNYLYRLNIDFIETHIEKHPDCTLQDLVDLLKQHDQPDNNEIVNFLKIENKHSSRKIKNTTKN